MILAIDFDGIDHPSILKEINKTGRSIVKRVKGILASWPTWQTQTAIRRGELMITGEIEYVGHCCVCDEPVDHSEMGNCVECGCVFHWSYCGGWGDTGHICDNCKEEMTNE